MRSQFDWIRQPSIDELEAFHGLRMRCVQVSCDDKLSLHFSPKPPRAIWLTRQDLHAWVWSVPFHRIKELFVCEHIGWICAIYRVSRPSNGSWLRADPDRRTAPIPLDLSIPADFPVPIFDFAYRPQDNAKVALFRGLAPFGRIGSPLLDENTGSLPDHLRSVSSQIKKIRLHTAMNEESEKVRAVLAPRGRLTRRKLRNLIKNESTEELALYGLTWRQVGVICAEEEMHPLNFEIIDRFRPWEKDRFQNALRRKRPNNRKNADAIIDLSVNRLNRISEVIAENDRIDDAKAAKLRLKYERAILKGKETKAKNLSVAKEHANLFLQMRVEGSTSREICRDLDVNANYLNQYFRERLTQRYPEIESWIVAEILKRIFHGSPRWSDALLLRWALRNEGFDQGPNTDTFSSGYMGKVTFEACARLADWLSCAKDVEEAQNQLEEQFGLSDVPATASDSPIIFWKH